MKVEGREGQEKGGTEEGGRLGWRAEISKKLVCLGLGFIIGPLSPLRL
jgi:hypothetical protein